MKICMPTDDDKGIEAKLARQLGHAPFLTVVDTDNDEVAVLPNEPRGNRACSPAERLEESDVEAVVCRGAGKRAVASLQRAGIRVMLTTADRVGEARETARRGELHALSVKDASAEGYGRGRGAGPGSRPGSGAARGLGIGRGPGGAGRGMRHRHHGRNT